MSMSQLPRLVLSRESAPALPLRRNVWGSDTGREYDADEPGLAVIVNPEQASQAEEWANLHAQAKLRALDYDAYLALVAFQGLKPSSEYGVEIARITRLGNTVNVYARFDRPEPRQGVADFIMYPYHLVKVEKAGDWGQMTFNLVVDGRVVATLQPATVNPAPQCTLPAPPTSADRERPIDTTGSAGIIPHTTE